MCICLGLTGLLCSSLQLMIYWVWDGLNALRLIHSFYPSARLFIVRRMKEAQSCSQPPCHAVNKWSPKWRRNKAHFQGRLRTQRAPHHSSPTQTHCDQCWVSLPSFLRKCSPNLPIPQCEINCIGNKAFEGSTVRFQHAPFTVWAKCVYNDMRNNTNNT